MTVETGLDEIQTMLAERACERLMYLYAQAVDFGEASKIADLFTEEGVWLGADGRGMNGRGEIHAAMSRRQGLTRRQSRHVITNVLVNIESPTSANGVAYLQNYRHDSDTGIAEKPAPAAPPKFVGEYHLKFARVDDTWLIEHLRGCPGRWVVGFNPRCGRPGPTRAPRRHPAHDRLWPCTPCAEDRSAWAC
jgi:hypothetical protein